MKEILILASGSPRRKEILLNYGYEFEIIKPIRPEIEDSSMNPHQLVIKNAENKALEIYENNPDRCIIAADTIVNLPDERDSNKGTLFGKPVDEEDAANMIYILQGKTHEVVTGVCIIDHGKKYVFDCTSYVSFYELTKEDIYQYLKSVYVLDKAGAYNIEEGYTEEHLVKEFQGDYFNVMGLPIEMVEKYISKYKNK